MSQSGYSFPTMKFDEIAEALSDWGLPVSESEIHRCKIDVIQSIYMLFVQNLMGITQDDLEESASRALITIEEHADLYTNSLKLNILMCHVRRIAYASRIQDFCMKDITQPETDRTRTILSAMINFVKFTEERGGFIASLRERSRQVEQEEAKSAKEVEDLRKKIAEIRDQRHSQSQKCEQLRQDNEKLQQVLIQMKGVQQSILDELDGLKKEKSSLTRHKESLMHDISVASNLIATTRSRIVQSPERIKKQIREMGTMAVEERKTVMANEGKSRHLKTKLDALAGFEEDINKCIAELKTIYEEHRLVENAQRKLGSVREELERKRVLRSKLQSDIERAKVRLQHAEDKLLRAQKEVTDKRARSQESISRLKHEYEQMSEERRENDKQVEALRQECNKIEREMAEHLKVNQAEMNALLAEYWNLRRHIEIYQETLANRFDMGSD